MHPLRERTRQIIFGHDTPAGKAFDVVLIVAILASVIAVILDSVLPLRARYGGVLRGLEWGFTILFSIEYVLRLWSARSALKYARSFYGIIDLFAVLPTYLATIFPEGRFLATIRVLRVARIFRVLKLAQYVREGGVLGRALWASRYKITVFVLTVLTIVTVIGALMYLIEGAESGFTSIPQGIYWAIVTLTTVGYGDIAPQTVVGRILAAAVMVLGYGVIAVPTGIVTLELDRASRAPEPRPACASCDLDGHEADARYCRRCGGALVDNPDPRPL